MVDPRKRVSRNQDNSKDVPSAAALFTDMSSPVGADLLRDRELMHKLERVTFKQPSHTRVITVANQKVELGRRRLQLISLLPSPKGLAGATY